MIGVPGGPLLEAAAALLDPRPRDEEASLELIGLLPRKDPLES